MTRDSTHGSQVHKLSKALSDNGYRLTRPRKAIIETLVDSRGHLTADELSERVHERSPTVGRMTVYRTLDLLCELGAIRPIYQGTGAAHFILMSGGSHHHLICNRCHGVIEFDSCTAGDVAQRLAAELGFTVSSHLLELHGICANCR